MKGLTLKDIGEVGLIDSIAKKFQDLTPSHFTGIGDDCSIYPLQNGKEQLITTDLLIEDVHFLKDKIGGYDLGYKTLAVNLSDIAAMGGTPLHYYLSMAFPTATPLTFIEDFFQALHDLSEQTNVALVGGDTTKSPDKIVLNITMVGEVNSHEVKKRSSAKVGQYICVTGELGDSSAGLQVLLNDIHSNDQHIKKLINKHHRPTPRLQEGRFLSQFQSVGAMMDLSDGLSLDLDRLCKASNCSAQIDLNRIPLSPSLLTVTKQYKWDALSLAVGGGEDYELLFTIDRDHYEKIGQQFYLIGEIVEKQTNTIQWFYEGKEVANPSKGFDHFNQEE